MTEIEAPCALGRDSMVTHTFSRRRLLHLVGAAAGSTAAYQAALGLGLMGDAKYSAHIVSYNSGFNLGDSTSIYSF